ncbi:MAG: type IX secretion system sortase PorU, partial [Flavobacteriaceae bacterium]|nr:type IX secretion system sortase PorU [Flavobacteriaceae bacterium]
LAQINRNQYGLNVKVLDLQSIYTEFSSGNQDVGAIRNMVKYVYNNASVPQNRLKYLCLFGDASYDYKDRISGNTNIVPSWHAYSSFNLTNSFISDDFFGMMDDNEGTLGSSDRLDVAVGRILADTPQRANELVDKVEQYYQKEAFGSWRNNFLVVSDDVDAYWEEVLQRTTNEIADEVTLQKPFINPVKIHSDSYLQEASAGGDRYPEVTKAMSDAIEVGALVVNYFGHGGEDGLAKERIFEQPDARNLRNICKFNCFVTVTCEYTKFDNPQRITAGEYTYWNKEGGAIGLITTTRQIFVTTGVTFNRTLSEYLFAYGSDDYPTMAEALRLTKIDPAIANVSQKRLVFFIGDPAMKLAFPKPNVRLSKINDIPIGQPTDTLKALSKVKIEGEVVDTAGLLMDQYNGILSATIYDKNIQRQTLANDGTRENQNGTGDIIKLDYETLGEIIFKGQATVTNGIFNFEFVVPRDIGIPVDNGRISFYTKTENPLEDQAGASTDLLVGGLNENAAEDNIGPTIQLYMNDENFVSGGITNENPTLLAKLEDENGINTASGIGHDIVAIIDGDETNPFVLNDYYETELDVYQRGTVSYAFRDLEPGLHTLTLKAWDVYNNSATQEIQFVVYDKDQELVINNVLNYPNPLINYTEFWFNHNSSDALDVSVQIFTVSGKLVKTINGQTNASGKATSSLSRDIVWDGRDDFGDKIGKGVYVYKLSVRSNQLNKTVEKYEKLVIL